FFQAEDGIRDFHVTGVQTCALPISVIAQDAGTGDVLMFAWMNAEALRLTVQEGRAVYWSRSRNKLWRKGEESGHVQRVQDLRLEIGRASCRERSEGSQGRRTTTENS